MQSVVCDARRDHDQVVVASERNNALFQRKTCAGGLLQFGYAAVHLQRIGKLLRASVLDSIPVETADHPSLSHGRVNMQAVVCDESNDDIVVASEGKNDFFVRET